MCKFRKPSVLYGYKELTVGLMNDEWLLFMRLKTTYALVYKYDFILMGCL